MDRYETSLYRFLFALIGDRDVAADCTQETFLRAYDHLRRSKPVNARWLFTVGRNRAMDEFRHRRRESAAAAALKPGMVEAQGEPHQRLAMREAYAQLSPDDRALLYMSAVEGLSGDEIAGRLDIKVAAVRSRLSRARRRFKLAYGNAV